jgi:sulfonate transport system permease protein
MTSTIRREPAVAVAAPVAPGPAPAEAAEAAAPEPETGHLHRPAFVGTEHRPRWRSLSVRIGIPVLLFGLWWWATTTGAVDPAILASPGEVLAAFTEMLGTGQLVEFVAASALRILLGVGLGVTVGLVLGLVSGLTALGEESVDPTMQMLRAVPFLALGPLLIAWFGIDELSKIVLIATSSAFPMYGYTFLAVRNVDRKMIEAARGFGLHGRRLVTEVILPTALPSILMALRICLAISGIALIAAESVNTTEGIGYLVLLAKQYARTDYNLLCIVLYAVLGLLFDGFVRLLEHGLMPWRRHSVVR